MKLLNVKFAGEANSCFLILAYLLLGVIVALIKPTEDIVIPPTVPTVAVYTIPETFLAVMGNENLTAPDAEPIPDQTTSAENQINSLVIYLYTPVAEVAVTLLIPSPTVGT